MIYTLERYFRIRKYNRYVEKYPVKKVSAKEEPYQESWLEVILGFIGIVCLLALLMFVGCLYR